MNYGVNAVATGMMDPNYVNMNGTGQVIKVLVATDKTYSVNWGINGDPLTTSGITDVDVLCSNGVLNIVDVVFTPFPGTVFDAARKLGLNDFIDAINTALLGDVFDLTAAVMILAPTDDAWSRINWKSLTQGQLSNILLYHIVPFVGYSQDAPVYNNTVVPTFKSGSSLTIRTLDKIYFVGETNNASVFVSDILIENGVLHVIDNVLMPSVI